MKDTYFDLPKTNKKIFFKLQIIIFCESLSHNDRGKPYGYNRASRYAPRFNESSHRHDSRS